MKVTREQLLSRFIADNDGSFDYLEGSDAAEWLKAGHASPTGVSTMAEALCDGVIYGPQEWFKDLERSLYKLLECSYAEALSIDVATSLCSNLRALIIDSARREIALAIKDAA